MSNSEEIKSIALSIVELCLAEGIVNRNSVKLEIFKISLQLVGRV